MRVLLAVAAAVVAPDFARAWAFLPAAAAALLLALILSDRGGPRPRS